MDSLEVGVVLVIVAGPDYFRDFKNLGLERIVIFLGKDFCLLFYPVYFKSILFDVKIYWIIYEPYRGISGLVTSIIFLNEISCF